MLKQSDNPFLIRNINQLLSTRRFEKGVNCFSSVIFGDVSSNVEIAMRQYLLIHLAGMPLNKTILQSLGDNNSRIIYPLPKEWIDLLSENGLLISRRLSTLYFNFFILKFLIFGLGSGVIQIIKSIFKATNKKKNCTKPYVYYIDLLPNCIPQNDNDNGFNIINWYINWSGRNKNIEEIRHNVNRKDFVYKSILLTYSDDIKYPDTFKKIISFGFWFLRASFIAIYSFCSGKWVNAFLFNEALKVKKVELLDKQDIADEYLFSISSAFYRPLWTYATKKHGAVSTMYNYAASFPAFLVEEGCEIGYQSMSWDRILQWSEPYAKFTKSVLDDNHVQVELVPCIYYSDIEINLPTSDKPCIVVFDISPMNFSYYISLVPDIEYRTFKNCQLFLEHIYDVVIPMGYNIMWKRKRSFSTKNHKAYIKFTEEFSKRPGIINIHPDISAFRLLRISTGAISVPFTSTALVAADFSIPSIFYDVTETVTKDNRGAQGIKLISGKTQLGEWVKAIKVENK